MLLASLKEIASSEMNRRRLCLVLTLCEETFRALKKWDTSEGKAMPKSLPCSDDFIETNEIQKPTLWHSELKEMCSTEIYTYVWVEVFVFSVLKETAATFTGRLWVLAPEYFFLE